MCEREMRTKGTVDGRRTTCSAIWGWLWLLGLGVAWVMFVGCSGEKPAVPAAADTSQAAKPGDPKDRREDVELERLESELSSAFEDLVPPATTTPRPYPYPADVMEPAWVAGRQAAQLATKNDFGVFCDFRFADRAVESGITFEHQSVVYACKINIAAHYDHGNGVAVADVDGDGLLDLYFSNQVGSNQLWKNLGGGRFRDITTPQITLDDAVGVSASFADCDNDGDPDLFVTAIRGPNRFFVNDGAGNFTDQTEEAGLLYEGHSSTGVFFDFDNDGLVDLFLCNVGVFTADEVDSEGIHPPLTEAFAGHLKPKERSERSILYKNVGHNRFADVTEQMGLVDNGWAGDASPIDVNGDGWLDLYVLNMQGHDSYYENVGGKRFQERSREMFPKTSWGAMGIQVFDFDNDGQMDIYVTDMHSDMSTPSAVADEKKKSDMRFGERLLRSGGNSIFGNSFFHNQGGQFVEISDRIGAENYWPWGLSTGDLNADGFEDVFVASSMNYPFRYCVNTLLLNDRGTLLRDSEYILGVEPRRDGQTAKPNFTLDPAGEDKDHQLVTQVGVSEPVEVWGALGSRSSVIFDLDNDGDLDIVTNEFNDGPMVLVSDLAETKSINWLKVRLVGKASNAGGLGATIQVTSGDLTMTKPNDGQSGYLSQSVQPIYFGLGDADSVEQIIVHWPSGNTQTVSGPLDSNQLIEVVED